MVKFTLRGLVPPVFTPLKEDGSVNYDLIPSYAKYLADAGIKGVLVGGTTGENMSLCVAERKKILDAWLIQSKTTGLHIMMQVGGAPLADVVDLASYCQSKGAHSLLVLPELYFKPANVNELVHYVGLVAAAAPKLPVLYYHFPAMTKVEVFVPDFIKAATAAIPNFKGLKFTSNDLSEGVQVLRALTGDQEIFLGGDTLIAPAHLLGIRSGIDTSINLFPKLAHDIVAAMEKRDLETARQLQEKLNLAIEAHTAEGTWVPIMKAGMKIVTGFNMGRPAPPLRELTPEAKNRIETKLRALGLLQN